MIARTPYALPFVIEQDYYDSLGQADAPDHTAAVAQHWFPAPLTS